MFSINVNGTEYSSQDDMNLMDYLRDVLHITSLKNGCGEGVCGACTILLDDKKVRACTQTLAKAAGKHVLTVEGLTEHEQEVYAWAFAEAGAVQCGFCIPGMVISAKSLIDKSPNPSSKEIKEAIRGNICRCTGYVKIEQGIMLAAKVLRGELQMKPTAPAGAGIGASIQRLDAREKVLGTGVYVDDMFVEGMLYAAVLRTSYPRALVKGIDTSAARVYPGVEAVLTAEDIPGVNEHGHIFHDWPTLIAVGQETRYVGDAVALVAAQTKKQAREALALIKVEYEELEPVLSPTEALAENAPRIHPKGNLLSTTKIKRGNVEEALAGSAYVVTNRYSTPPTEHAFMEPESALAVPEDDGVTVYVGDQSVYDDLHGIMGILGLPAEKVRIVSKLVGGGFGGKEDLSVQHHAALLAYITKKPVKLTLSRKESLLVHPKRHAMELEVTTGCDQEGRLTALTAKIVADTGAYASLGTAVLQRACTHVGGPYQIPNVDILGLCVYTNNPPAGAFRGFGVPQGAFASETNLDLLAEKVGISPWDIRYLNALEPGMVNPTGQITDEGTAIKETLLAVREVYESHPYAGIASCMKNTGVGVGLPDTGRVKLKVQNGKVLILTSAACIGQGLATIATQIVNEATGLPLEQIAYGAPDTFLTPDSGTTTASRQTLFTGEAVRQAALKLQDALYKSSLEELEGKEFYGEYLGKTDPIDSDKPNPISHVAYSYATQVVILNEQGLVEKVVAAHDVGRAINPKAVEGQIEGGVVMGLGYALREDFPLKNGVPTAKFGTLGLLRSTDVPEIESIIIEKNNSPLAYGAKGIGEISSIPTAPAVALAYHKFDGKLRCSLPLSETPYKK